MPIPMTTPTATPLQQASGGEALPGFRLDCAALTAAGRGRADNEDHCLFAGPGHELAERATEPSAKAHRSRGFQVEVLVERGDPAEVISERAAEHEVDLIVMGTRGHSKIRQILLGSTTERVVEHAPCPVLTVHQREGAVE